MSEEERARRLRAQANCGHPGSGTTSGLVATRPGYRRRGIMYPLARAAVGFARQRDARAVEGYPMITRPGEEITWGELHVGSYSA